MNTLDADLQDFLRQWHSPQPTLVVQTSGSTGAPKQLHVEKSRMLASARMTCDFFGLEAGNRALLCLPLQYIAGKMMVVRSLQRGLQLIHNAPSTPEAGFPFVHFAAMVPAQVHRLLQDEQSARWLRSIPHLLLGGGAIDTDMEQTLRTFPHGVWSSYGMTETLSHIALRRLSGPEASLWYTPLPGIGLSLTDDGCLAVDAPALCSSMLVTHDLAELRSDGSFRILGRSDNVICSGGIKIQAEEVERLLHPILAGDFCITWQRDAAYGQAVTLLCTIDPPTNSFDALPHRWRPKHVIVVAQVPRTGTGKIDRAGARQIAQRAE